ncbi:MAG: hypothetical protein M5R36_03085 [Deltaproteobacteria bacterium]|nr:hypothetical protein [Deltaproteobacteria bacterium]
MEVRAEDIEEFDAFDESKSVPVPPTAAPADAGTRWRPRRAGGTSRYRDVRAVAGAGGSSVARGAGTRCAPAPPPIVEPPRRPPAPGPTANWSYMLLGAAAVIILFLMFRSWRGGDQSATPVAFPPATPSPAAATPPPPNTPSDESPAGENPTPAPAAAECPENMAFIEGGSFFSDRRRRTRCVPQTSRPSRR